ncbi:hypothetical protein CcaverHIS002_0209590 [Cutaneotrichosporon cavernicola]|uniref:S-adenosyl-L-methionine-dependent methyltransferase n=1 Tax=Cutaneotrichosporon cavernicola TaxID=279322 RepID=A0AA48KYN7_9TREE|nr:uncharacterized protein CcaverHIS019_0209610 [Cutaneotrichosporon cavernicola]BEI81799.1 hypothetical protein CcaverHIS002_0209590 [Cutaneotrichosporon cavernicola]BEI89599.1 hypothetical protein CcaverHIS019_0209610 [Cutaneotrichosporon cavernicola]BEI97371.1 hypothetical protein CcaverHIS631_0209600 [Cutaneotrichosporon cavernicola]BEJ05148.1 hypothetical protein CcaverHIS641_0209650 [Cutaneotrichosporon cavernicola]
MVYAVDVLYGLWEPILFLGLSAAYLPSTFLQILRDREWGALASFDQFSYIWFANLWRFAGPVVREGAEARVVPLLQGRVRAGAIVGPDDGDSPLPAGVGGTVIEIGPGSGNWVNIFSDKYLLDHANNKADGGYRTRVDKAYGIEPNADHHTTLRQRVRDSGLEGRYEVVPMGIQDIGASGLIAKGSVDAIVTVMCLCSIPEPEKNIRELYTYLKPGGRWFVYEHVKCHRSQGTFMSVYQRLLNVIWPSFMGGCDLCRDTATSLFAAGDWTEFDLAMPVDEPWWATTPHTYGILTK